MHAHTHMHTHAHSHTCTRHTRTHTCTHKHTRSHAGTHACTHACPHSHAYTHTHSHTCTHMHIHTTRSHVHSHAHTACARTHSHTCTHVHAETHTHTHVPTHTGTSHLITTIRFCEVAYVDLPRAANCGLFRTRLSRVLHVGSTAAASPGEGQTAGRGRAVSCTRPALGGGTLGVVRWHQRPPPPSLSLRTLGLEQNFPSADALIPVPADVTAPGGTGGQPACPHSCPLQSGGSQPSKSRW